MVTSQSSHARLRSCGAETACGKCGSSRNGMSSASFSPKQKSAVANTPVSGEASELPIGPRLNHPARLCPTKPVRSQGGKKPTSFGILSTLLRIPAEMTCSQKGHFPRRRSSRFSKRTLVAALVLRLVCRCCRKRLPTPCRCRNQDGNTCSADTNHTNCSLSSRR